MKAAYPNASRDFLRANNPSGLEPQSKSERVKAKKVSKSSLLKESGSYSLSLEREGRKKTVTIKIDYPGSCITVNHYLGRTRTGNLYVKKEAQEWADELTALLIQSPARYLKAPIKVNISGVFKNARQTPDIHNLLKLICDTIQRYTGINDREYKTETEIPVIDKFQQPHLVITIEELSD